ncbi:hypothetical protein GCM10025868_14640 [Angustibacter aerolatus]|uniref:Glycosyltransferase family 2 protein n=1 Tax=Angustibacter aerolatus TaxID=1162965 RepID=A0ABQ6JFM7_9ACTN|nr:glycosyltransferase family 2 protein [Angustibacter aerolatus]GMA86214.1 hypothetical protein GCM10025868_14640 [Angustibacter aerolatus]
MSPRLGVVVVNYRSHDLLPANLGGIDLSALPGSRVVVVDNLSTEAERADVQRVGAAHGWDVVLAPGNLGFGSGVNLGAQHALAAGCDVLLIINPDATIGSADLVGLVREVAADPGLVLAPRIERPDGRVWFRGAELDLLAGRTRATEAPAPGAMPWLTGACLVVHRDTWLAAAGMDDDYFMYWEDVDLSRRLLDVGARLEVRHDVVAVHSVGGSQESVGEAGRTKSRMYYYYNCRNRLLFAARHLPRRQALRWTLSSPAYAKSVVLRGGRRRLLASRAP